MSEQKKPSKDRVVLKIKSCLIETDPHVKLFDVELADGTVNHFKLRALTSEEKLQARENATKPGSVLGLGSSNPLAALRSSIEPEVLNRFTVFYALGGARKLADEGWDLVDASGTPVPITLDVLKAKIPGELVDILALIAAESLILTEAEARNLRSRSA